MSSSDEFIAPSPEELSEMISGFKVVSLLSADSHSAVYQAIQMSLERQVALRLYSPVASSDPERVSSLQATTRAMAKLKHPNLIGMFDSGVCDGMIYVVMEFVAGRSLARSLGGSPVHHAQVRSIICGICDGLAHAHQNKVAHGALSVDNILLNPEAEPKIGSFQGGDFEKGQISDIVEVGRLLYLMLTGVESTPRSVEPSVLASSPKEFDDIWLRCTRRDHPDAFAAVDEIVQILTKSRTKTKQPAASASPRKAATLVAAKSPPVTQPFLLAEKLPHTPPHTTKKVPSTMVSKNASQWVLVRNLVVIIVLIIAIIKVWGMTQSKERQIQQEQQEAHARALEEQKKNRQKAIEDQARKAEISRQNNPTQNSELPLQPQEIREAALHEIRDALADGKRDVLPTGSVRRGDSAYLLVKDELTWPEAFWYAEQHGAHLAIPDETADLKWFKSFADGHPFWLGAGKSGRTSWQLVDGTPWQPTKQPVGMGRFLAADKHGFLRAAGHQVRLPFILQWRMNGSNPGQLESLLEIAADSIKNGDSVYPPGTYFVADQAYMVVTRDVDWAEAHHLASLAGGHLAVVSDTGETVHIDDLAKHFSPDHLYWLGADKKSAGWQWVTGEPWRDGRISAESGQAGDALAISNSTVWQAVDSSTVLSGFIIEWDGRVAQPVSSTETPQPEVVSEPPSSEDPLDLQAKKLLKSAMEKRDKDLKHNSSRMESDLSIVLRGMPDSLQREWSPHVQALKLLIVDMRVDTSTDLAGMKMNEAMQKIVTYAISKQQSIDEEYVASANVIRLAYQKKLRDNMASALEKDDRTALLAMKPKLEASEELNAWLNALGMSSME